MNTRKLGVSIVSLVVVLMLPAALVAQSVEASHNAGLLTIRCTDAPLESVFTRIEQEAGVELILEDSVKAKRLSADLVDVPLAMAVQRLLEGAGVNYAVMMDPFNWGRVDKIFVGAGGGGPSRPQPPPRRPPVRPPVEPDFDEMDMDEDGFDDMDEFEEALEEMDEFDPDMEGMENPEDFEAPPDAFPTPGTNNVPNYLPSAPSFPRSRFTPGLPGNTGAQPPQNPNPGANPDPNQPGSQLPFLDPFGRPIPSPGGDPNDPNNPNRRPPQE